MCMYHCIINTIMDILYIIRYYHMLYIMINIKNNHHSINNSHLYIFNSYMFQWLCLECNSGNYLNLQDYLHNLNNKLYQQLDLATLNSQISMLDIILKYLYYCKFNNRQQIMCILYINSHKINSIHPNTFDTLNCYLNLQKPDLNRSNIQY